MELNSTNLEKYGWLFSPSLSVVVSEHELGGGEWDVELQSYRNVNSIKEPVYEHTDDWFTSELMVSTLISKNPELKVKDWIHGDKVEFL